MPHRFLWRAVVLLTALLLQFSLALADADSEIEDLRAAMARLGDAFVSEDVSAIRSLMTPDHIAVGPTYPGPVSIDEQVAMFPRISLAEWVPTEPEISLLSDTVATITFGLSIRGTFDDVPLHSSAYVTEIWIKRDGQWLQHLYQETAVGGR